MSNWWSGMTYSEWQAEDSRRRLAEQKKAEMRKTKPMFELIGRRVSRVLINKSKNVIVFETEKDPFGADDGMIAFMAAATMGEAWFADVTGLDEIRGHVVQDCERIEVQGQKDGRGRTSNEEFYGVRLKTDAGTADLVFRCSYEGMTYSGGIYGTVDPPGDLKELTGDEWSA